MKRSLTTWKLTAYCSGTLTLHRSPIDWFGIVLGIKRFLNCSLVRLGLLIAIAQIQTLILKSRAEAQLVREKKKLSCNKFNIYTPQKISACHLVPLHDHFIAWSDVMALVRQKGARSWREFQKVHKVPFCLKELQNRRVCHRWSRLPAA